MTLCESQYAFVGIRNGTRKFEVVEESMNVVYDMWE
jgi:hypothetical protein